MKNYYLDTEFDQTGPTVELISLALVCEDGRELYLINPEARPTDPWLITNVMQRLYAVTNAPTVLPIPVPQWKRMILDFIGDDRPRFWAYYAAHDWFLFSRLFGTFEQFPTGFPQLCFDIEQYRHFAYAMGRTIILPAQNSTKHNALNDARWCRDAHRTIMEALR